MVLFCRLMDSLFLASYMLSLSRTNLSLIDSFASGVQDNPVVRSESPSPYVVSEVFSLSSATEKRPSPYSIMH